MNFFVSINNGFTEYPKYSELQFFREKVGNTAKFILFSRFLDILYVLLASEASSERLFSYMECQQRLR